MNKNEFVSLMAEISNGPKTDAEKSLNLVIEGVIKALEKGQEVNLVGFGSFYAQNRKAREGRNPKTGEKIKISAYNQPMFKAGKKLKDACN